MRIGHSVHTTDAIACCERQISSGGVRRPGSRVLGVRAPGDVRSPPKSDARRAYRFAVGTE